MVLPFAPEYADCDGFQDEVALLIAADGEASDGLGQRPGLGEIHEPAVHKMFEAFPLPQVHLASVALYPPTTVRAASAIERFTCEQVRMSTCRLPQKTFGTLA